jgi:hypothetical protein
MHRLGVAALALEMMAVILLAWPVHAQTYRQVQTWGGHYTPFWFGAKGNAVIHNPDTGDSGGTMASTSSGVLTITPPSFTGSIPANSNTLTVSGVSGTIQPGPLNGPGVPTGTLILSCSGSTCQLNEQIGPLTNVAMTSGVLFTAADVGKAIVVNGAAPQFPSPQTPPLVAVVATLGNKAALPLALVTTIASVQSATQITLAANPAFTVTNAWFAYGTDDTAAIRACVNAGTNVGGTCTINDGVQFMVSNANTEITVNPGANGFNSGKIDGHGTIVLAAVGPENHGVNDALFYLISGFGSNLEIANSIAKGATSITATNASDAETLTAGEYISLCLNNAYENLQCDWAQVAATPTSATIQLTQPTRLAFTVTSWGTGGYPGLGFRAIGPCENFSPSTCGLAQNITVTGMNFIAPNVNYGSAFAMIPIQEEFTLNTLITGNTCTDVAYSCFVYDYDKGTILTNNTWRFEGIEMESSTTVDTITLGNTFDHQQSSLTGYGNVCNLALEPTAPILDGGSGFFIYDDNVVPNYCLDGWQGYEGVHDGEVAQNVFGYAANAEPNTDAADGIVCFGCVNVDVEFNHLAGAPSGTAGQIGIAFKDNLTNATQYSANNQAIYNQIDPSYGTPILLGGSEALDIAVGNTQGSGTVTTNGAQVFAGPLTAGASGAVTQSLVSPLRLGGNPGASCLQMRLGNFPGAGYSTVGIGYDYDGAFQAFNAGCAYPNADAWEQYYGGIVSTMFMQTQANGFAQYGAVASGAEIQGYGSGNTATVSSTTTGTPAAGMTMTGVGITAATITAYSSPSLTFDGPAQSFASSGSPQAVNLSPPKGGVVTGYISGTTLHVPNATAGTWIESGFSVNCTLCTAGTTISSGTAGQSGTWTVNNSQTVGSSGSPVSITIGNPFANFWTATGWSVNESGAQTATNYTDTGLESAALVKTGVGGLFAPATLTSGDIWFGVAGVPTPTAYFPPLPASLVTTAASSDNVTVTGMTSSGHCSIDPTNAAAATNIATTYISAKTTNQITVTHAATANMNYDILCTGD